jgi:hypothetical protein
LLGKTEQVIGSKSQIRWAGGFCAGVKRGEDEYFLVPRSSKALYLKAVYDVSEY